MAMGDDSQNIFIKQMPFQSNGPGFTKGFMSSAGVSVDRKVVNLCVSLIYVCL